MKKIMLICAMSISVKSFRIPLIKTLQKEGYRVGVVVFDDDNKELIQSLGVDYFCVGGDNRTTNPLKFLKTKKAYSKIIKEYQPDAVLTFMVKPNTLGVPAAKKAGVKKVVSFVEGLGDVFILNSLKMRLVRKIVCWLYKKAFKKVDRAIFLNNDDKQEFLRRKLIKEDKCETIHGIGVDLERFTYSDVKNSNVFLMIARMLKTKGIMEYCEAARLVKQKYPEAQFNYLGGEGTVSVEDVKEYIDKGELNYLGEVQDVRPYIEDCGVFVLPSYREGLPVSVMEAEAVGRAILASDCEGCRETVVDGYNGFLIERSNSQALADKMCWFIENPEKVKEMGLNARKFAQENFDEKIINTQILEIIG